MEKITKKQLLIEIKKFIGVGGCICYEHGYKTNITLDLEDSITYQVYGCTPTQVLLIGKYKNGSIVSYTTRVSLNKLAKDVLQNLWLELNDYYKYVISLSSNTKYKPISKT